MKKISNAFLVMLYLLTLPASILAQQPLYDSIELRYNEKQPPLLSSTPFSHVQVIDNRFDTTPFYTYQTGKYPMTKLTFGYPPSEAIRQFLQSQIDHLERGQDTLLINLQQLRIPNQYAAFKRYGKKGHIRHSIIRDYIVLSLQAYRKTGEDSYQPILDIPICYYYHTAFKNDLELLLNNVLVAAGLTEEKYNTSYGAIPKKRRYAYIHPSIIHYTTDTGSIPWSAINTSITSKWAHYPILQKELPTADGIYPVFEDFCRDTLLPATGRITWNEKDSVYNYTIHQKRIHGLNRTPWAVAEGGAWYIHLREGKYLRLYRTQNTFTYHIPETEPDMYAIMSIEQHRSSGGLNTPSNSSGNFLVDLTALLLVGAIDSAVKNKVETKIAKRGIEQPYRTCYLDMDTGDTIYQ